MRKKYKIMLLVIAILLVISVVIGSSYAFYNYSDELDDVNVAGSDCFEITYHGSNDINLVNAIPMSDNDANSLVPYTFTIKNICNHDMNYSINLETLEGSSMNLNAIKAKLNNFKSDILGEIENNDPSVIVNKNLATSSKTLRTGVLFSGDEKTFDLRLYIDENSTISQSASKTYNSKIAVITTLLNDNITQLVPGYEFKSKLSSVANIYELDAVRFSNTLPEGVETVLISTDESKKEVLAYYSESDNTVYIYSESEKIYLNEDCSNMFDDFSSTEIELSRFDSSRVENMTYMFANLRTIETLDFSNFDTSRVTDMSYMFYNYDSGYPLTSLDLSSFDTSNVLTMEDMFHELWNLLDLDVSSFDTSKVENMSNMFGDLRVIETLDISNFDTSNVTDMYMMFYNCRKLVNLNLGNLDTSKVENMSHMFEDCKSLVSIDLSSFNTTSVTDLSEMFEGMQNITELDISSFEPTSATNMREMFKDMTSVVTIYVSDKWPDTVTANTVDMFKNCYNLVGGAGTVYNSIYSYPRVDDPDNGRPGYFTLKTN